MTEALERAPAYAPALLLTTVDTCDDDVLDPDAAVERTEHTAYRLGRLAPADRRRLAGLFHDTALREPDGDRRDALDRLPGGLGLDDDPHAGNCDAVEEHVARFVKTVRDADPATPVSTCPGWTLADLVRHHGTTHRWTDLLVRTRATARVRPRDVPLDLPGDPAEYPDWLAGSAEVTLRTLRAADPDAGMWSHGADLHVRFFPRRLLFEAVVHLAWTLRLGGGGFTWHTDGERGPRPTGIATAATTATATVATTATAPATVTATAPATVTVDATSGEPLLLLYGRYGAGDRRYAVTGDRTLLDAWPAATRL
ncbi:maleylpyruvate isomerase N-terminal domain-containing protein [Streptomyces sp. TRM49041]|uniref:maleylpyruvate isomerase N-terminal domain-containing protein n=1 Tax=Streptomyces sp. TRM49041 TaxID=2603216 RepID=UPI0011F002D9|nr:maleylpyruvate isomerase N-terminal domain-containing protein [Streptomyces sp. TRM49041]